jgi:hypothetical protein
MSQPTIEKLLDKILKRNKKYEMSNLDNSITPDGIPFRKSVIEEIHVLHSGRVVKTETRVAYADPSQFAELVNVSPSLFLGITLDDLHYLWKAYKTDNYTAGREIVESIIKRLEPEDLTDGSPIFLSIEFLVDLV